MGETHNVISQKRISRALKLVPILSNKARLLDLVGHCNQACVMPLILGTNAILPKTKELGRMYVCTYVVTNSTFNLT